MMRRAPWLPCLRSKPLSSTTSAKRTPHQIPPSPPCAPSPPFSPRTETGKSLNLEERARGVHTHTRTKEVCVSASFARAPPPRTPHERRARRAQAPGTRDRALLLAPGALPRERRPGAKKRERGLGFCLPSQGDPPAFAPLSLSLATVSRSLPPLRALVTRPLVVLLWACRHAARGVVAKKRGRSRERGARLSLLLSRPPHSFSLFALHLTSGAHLSTAPPLLTSPLFPLSPSSETPAGSSLFLRHSPPTAADRRRARVRRSKERR